MFIYALSICSGLLLRELLHQCGGACRQSACGACDVSWKPYHYTSYNFQILIVRLCLELFFCPICWGPFHAACSISATNTFLMKKLVQLWAILGFLLRLAMWHLNLNIHQHISFFILLRRVYVSIFSYYDSHPWMISQHNYLGCIYSYTSARAE